MSGRSALRVLILSQYFAPEPIPKPADLAEELTARGHRVVVLTGLPNYPSGRLFPGYRLCLWRRERHGEVPVLRTFEVPYHGRGTLGRMLNYGSFMTSAVLGSLFLPRCDVMYVWHPPLSVGVAAWLVSRLRGTPFVYDVQDIWPEAAVLSGILQEGRVSHLMARLERFVYGKAAHLLVVTPGARENLMGKGVHPGKVTVMPHWIDEEMFAPPDPRTVCETRARNGWDGCFVAMFAGNLGLVQGLDTLLHAAGQIASNRSFRLVLVGDGADRERLKQKAQDGGLLDSVTFAGPRPLAEMPVLLAAADALVVHLKRSPLSRLVIPTKTLAYLAAGRPVVMAMEGAAADLVAESGGGIVVPPEDPEALGAALCHIAALGTGARRAMGERGRAFALARFAKDVVMPEYEELLGRVAREARR